MSKPKEYDERFKRAVKILLDQEGGYVADPDDPGGETKYGISKASYPDLDIPSLTQEEAIEIYFRDFWNKYHYDRIQNDTIACMVFSMAVVMGPKRAHRFLQAALRKDLHNLTVIVDGIMGPKTISAVNAADPAALIRAFGKRCEIYFRALNMPKFLSGWLARVHSFKEA